MQSPIEFDLSRIPIADLAGIFNWATTRGERFIPFALWLADLTGSEYQRRETEDPPMRYFAFPEHWTNYDVGEALEGVTALSYAQGVDAETTGKFIDTITIHLTALASARLKAKHLNRKGALN